MEASTFNLETALPEFLSGGGEMGSLIRSTNWFETALGNPASWPQPLRTAVRIMLDTPFGMYIAWGKEYTQLYNDGYRPILGATKHPQALGSSSRQTFAEIWPTIGPMFEGVMRGMPIGFPDFILHLNRNGFLEECVFDFSYSPIRLDNGEVGGVLVTVVETTEKIKAAKALKEGEQELKFAIEAAGLATWDLNPVTNKFKGNSRLKEWFGLHPDEEIELPFALAAIADKDREDVKKAIQTALQFSSGGGYDITYTIIHPHTGKERIVRAKGLASFNEEGVACRFNGTLQDVSEEVTGRRAMINNEYRFRGLIEQAPVAMCLLRGNTFIIEVANKRVLELWGKPAEQVMNKPLFEGMPDAAGQGLEELLNNVYETGIPFVANERLVTLQRNGKHEALYINFVYEPLRESDGTISGVVAVATEVTEQVITRKRIEESEEKLRIAIEGGELGTYDYYPQTGKLNWSPKTKELFGLPPDAEVDYNTYFRGLHPDDKERFEATTQKAMEPGNGGLYENEYRTIGITDGKLRWVRSKGIISFDEQGKPSRFTGVTQDITQQKEILRSLQMQSLVLESMDEGVSVSDEHGVILLTNATEDKMFGYAPGELIGKHVTVQNAYAPEENETVVKGVIAELKQNGFWSGEWHNRKKDGTAFYTNSFITQLQTDGGSLFVCVQRDVTEDKKAREALAYRTALLEAQNEAIPDAILIVDTKGKMLSFNQHFVELWNIPKEIVDRKDDAAALQFAMTQLVDAEAFINRVNYCYLHPEEKAREEVVFKDGRVIERYGNAVLGEDGTSYGWAWYFRDVTKGKKAGEALKIIKNQLELTFKNVPAAIYLFDKEGELLFTNPNGAQLMGYETVEEILAKKEYKTLKQRFDETFDVLTESREPLPAGKSPTALTLTTARPAEAILLFIKKSDKKEIWVLSKSAPLLNDNGELAMVLTTSTDITAQKLSEETVRQSEESFRTLANSIPQLSWMTDAAGWIYWYNQRWYDYTGTTFEEMQGWGWQTVHHPDLIEGVIERFKNAIAAGAPWEDTFLLRGKDGQFRWFLSRALPIRNEQNEIVQWFGTNTDISAQRETEEALKSAKVQLELTFQNVPSAIYHFDKTGKILYLNEKGAEQLGYATIEEVLAEKDIFSFRKKLEETFTVLDENGKPLPSDKNTVAITLTTGKSAEVVSQFINKKTGGIFWLLSKSAPLFDERGELYMVLTTSTDITLQKTSEQAIRQSEEKFRTLAETLPQLVWMTDEKGDQEYTSMRWEEYTGLKPEGWESWVQMLHPDDLPLITKDWLNSISTGSLYKSEARLKNKQGEFRWHFVQGEPIKNEEGKILKWIGAFTDIHDQKTLTEKLEKLVAERTKELQRSNEDLQQFAHVASHDLKEPVRKIKTFSSRFEEEFGSTLNERGRLYLDKVQAAADRMFAMIEGVLTYSTINALDQGIETIALSRTLQNIEADLEILIQQKAAVITSNNLPQIEGIPVLIHQLFYNLVNNSLKFSKADRPLKIWVTGNVEMQEEAATAIITVTDNGIGFDQNQAEKIFTTFSRLNSKDQYEGTGLGLSLCRKIVERHGGIITAEGVPDGGAAFTIQLPVTQRGFV